MSPSTAEAKAQRDAQVKALSQQKEKLENRSEQMYLDKLDGNLSDEEYSRLSNKFRGQLTDIKFNIEKLQAKNDKCIDSKSRVLELAQSAATLYSAQIPDEKRKLLNLVCSNSTLAAGEVTPNYRNPFDMIEDMRKVYQKEKVTNPEKSDLFEIWRRYRLLMPKIML
jgi:hypothetical protein